MRLFTLHLTAPSLLERGKCRGLIHRGLPSGRHRKRGSPSRVAPLPATPFSHLRTALSLRPMPVRPAPFSRADQCATKRLSPLPTNARWQLFSPASVIFGTKRTHAFFGFGISASFSSAALLFKRNGHD